MEIMVAQLVIGGGLNKGRIDVCLGGEGGKLERKMSVYGVGGNLAFTATSPC